MLVFGGMFLKLMYEMVVCHHCGKKVPLGKFCTNCGAKFIVSNSKQNLSVDVCLNCGSLTPDRVYCSACGFHKNYERLF